MKLVFTPDWFLGPDVLIESFSFIVLFIFFALCIRNYKINKKKNFLYLGIGFLLIALAQISVILTKLVLYYDTTFIREIGNFVIRYHVVKSVDIFYDIGFFMQRFLTLLGFYVIYRIISKNTKAKDAILAVYFIILSAVVSQWAYYLFHLTALVLLILIIENYYECYKKNKFTNTLLLLTAFTMLALSQFIYIMSNLAVFFVAANIIELLSYIILLAVIIKIFRVSKKIKIRYGKKKKSVRNNI